MRSGRYRVSYRVFFVSRLFFFVSIVSILVSIIVIFVFGLRGCRSCSIRGRYVFRVVLVSFFSLFYFAGLVVLVLF